MPVFVGTGLLEVIYTLLAVRVRYVAELMPMCTELLPKRSLGFGRRVRRSAVPDPQGGERFFSTTLGSVTSSDNCRFEQLSVFS
jgi:hypothetical protein